MAMAAIEAISLGGPGGWTGLLLTSGGTLRGKLAFVRMRRRALGNAEELSSTTGFGAGRLALSSHNGERVKTAGSSAVNDGAWSRETGGDSEFAQEGGDHVIEAIHTTNAPNSRDGSSLFREYGAGQEGGLSSTSLEESTSRSGRRDFSTSCLCALALFSITGKIGNALAEETQAKPEKKKGRAPSSPYDEDRLLEQNRRMQRLNKAPTEFPGFVREGFQVKVITSDKYVTSKSGLIYYDMVVGNGDLPQDGQQVIFHYTGYNESGRRVDSSYQQGRPARTRLGIQGMIPGFEEGIKSMRAGGRRIIIVPPELGPPVGPSTFFSAKQFEVFDVELLETKECSRRTLLFYSDVVCD